MSDTTGKRLVLIGAGFLGKFFIQEWLGSNPYNTIVVLDKIPKLAFFDHPLTRNLATDDRITYVHGSAGDADTNLKKYFDGTIDFVVYTAAIADVGYAAMNPKETLYVNVHNTGEFFEFLGNTGFKPRCVILSSESVYKKKQCLPVKDYPAEKIAFKETDELEAHSVYGDTKMKQEEIAKAKASTYGLDLTVIRSATMYGLYGRLEQVIPAYIRDVLEDRNLSMMGTGTETSRDFINVMDTVSGIKAVLEAPKENVVGETFNIGTGRETFLLNLANAIKEICGQPSEAYDKRTGAPRLGFKQIKHKDFRAGEQGARIVLDISKAKEKLKMRDMSGKEVPWEPQIDLLYGLKATIYWMAKVVGNDDAAMEEWHRKLYPEKYKGRTEANPHGTRVS